MQNWPLRLMQTVAGIQNIRMRKIYLGPIYFGPMLNK